MSEPVVIRDDASSEPIQESESLQKSSDPRLQESLALMVLEIDKIPKEYWPKLLEIIRLFRESVAMKPAPSDARAKLMEDIKNPDPIVEAARQQALSDLLRKWREEGDEEEQTETAEILRQALEENPVSI